MPESDPVKRQRKILQIFRQAAARRAEIEADAEARYKAEREAADAALTKVQQEAKARRTKAEGDTEARRNSEQQAAGTVLKQVQQTAAAQLGKAHEAQEQARGALSKAGGQEQLRRVLVKAGLPDLLHQAKPAPPYNHSGDDPAQELAHSTTVAIEAATAVPDAVEALQRQRDAARTTEWVMAFAIGAALILLTVAGFQGYRSWQAEQRVATAPTAIAAARATAVADTPPALRPLVERFGMAFVYVPPGEFTMGNPERGPEREGASNEHPQHTVYLDGFWIGLTEVTNAQYRLFIEAGSYQQQELWTEAGWSWRQENNVTEPWCWNDEEWNQPDYPVVCVSWYEATTYTHWLAQETGLDVRLPTEAEWEKAARGTNGRSFPWGDDWDETKANTGEGGANRTTPVGAYPAGASPYGVLDMAGNVWEWTSSLIEDYPYQPDDGREELEGSECCRVVRGGAWRDDLGDARSANRDWSFPDHGNDSLGVRVVVAAPR